MLGPRRRRLPNEHRTRHHAHRSVVVESGRVRLRGPCPRRRARSARHDPTAPSHLVAGAEASRNEQHREVRALRRPSVALRRWSSASTTSWRRTSAPRASPTRPRPHHPHRRRPHKPLATRPLDPGPVIATGFGASDSVTIQVHRPRGLAWIRRGRRAPCQRTEAPDGMGIILGEVNAGLFQDPCHWAGGEPEIPVGPTRRRPGERTCRPYRLRVVGASRRQSRRLRRPTGGPPAALRRGVMRQRRVITRGSDQSYAQGPDNRWNVWILDVEGERIVVLATSFPGTSAEDLAEQQAIIDSLVIEP